MKHYIKQRLRKSLISEEKLSDDELNNLKELIQSGQDDNIKLAFTIASGHGEDIQNELFTYWYNHIKSDDKTWDELKNMEGLDLYGNLLTTLPDSIGKLTNLKVLVLSDNELITLPDSIRKLTNLKVLYLGYNTIINSERERITALLPNTKIYFD